jgi:hypothetical protein
MITSSEPSQLGALSPMQMQQLLASLQACASPPLAPMQSSDIMELSQRSDSNPAACNIAPNATPLLQQLLVAFSLRPPSRNSSSNHDNADDSDNDEEDADEAADTSRKRKRCDKSHNMTQFWHLINETNLWIGQEGYFVRNFNSVTVPEVPKKFCGVFSDTPPKTDFSLRSIYGDPRNVQIRKEVVYYTQITQKRLRKHYQKSSRTMAPKVAGPRLLAHYQLPPSPSEG